MTRAAVAGLIASILAVSPAIVRGQAPSKPAAINNWAEFRRALAACWTVPAGTEGSNIAFRFGVDRYGAIRGTALVTARQLKGDGTAQRVYEDAARALLARCFPMTITPSFGAALGESPIRLRLTNTTPEAAYQINSNITLFAPPAR